MINIKITFCWLESILGIGPTTCSWWRRLGQPEIRRKYPEREMKQGPDETLSAMKDCNLIGELNLLFKTIRSLQFFSETLSNMKDIWLITGWLVTSICKTHLSD